MDNLLSGLLGAIIGAVIGGAATGLVAWRVLVSERKNREKEAFAELRRQLTVDFVRSVTDEQECARNPSRNADRLNIVLSELEANLALFNAHLHLPREAAVAEFAHRLKHSVQFAGAAGSVWADETVLSRQALEPLLRWSTGEPGYPVGWFKAHLSENQNAFSQTKFDIEPEHVRRAM